MRGRRRPARAHGSRPPTARRSVPIPASETVSIRPEMVDHRRMIDAIIRLVRTLPARIPAVQSADLFVEIVAISAGVAECTADAVADYAIRVSI